ncbi:MAG: hypothetical protein J6B77_09630 [Clostridia bacterium]|nr:hypothetical protein [Clostridia bacterium]
MTLFNAQKLYLSAPEVIRDGAERMRLLLSHLGHPERKLNILPVAGHKGKSSVVRMLAGMLAASGVRSASLILPLLPTPRDNVFSDDKPLPNEVFIRCTESVAQAVRAARAEDADAVFSQNELLFALTLTVAEGNGAKWLIAEIPSGDPLPMLSLHASSPLAVITSCGAKIPPSALGVIRPELTEVVSAQLGDRTAYAKISAACARAGCRLTVPAFSGLTVSEASIRRTVFIYRQNEYTVPLYGGFALTNAICAIETASALIRHRVPITEKGIREGLLHAALPGRGTFLSISPTVIADAADDPFSCAALCELLLQRNPSDAMRLTVCTDGSTDPSPLLRTLTDAGIEIAGCVPVNMKTAHRSAVALLKEASPDDVILAFGSLPFAFVMQTEFTRVLCTL